MNETITTDDRHLMYVKETHTEHGVMPPYYIEVSSTEVADWIAEGGVDVTDSLPDQQAYRRQVDTYYSSIL